jgi:hypothetical protein
MNAIDYFSLGADPELFIVNTKTDKVVSAVGMIPGEKGNPYTEGLPKGYGLETDNILAEFNIPPVYDKEDFVESILYMQNYIDKFVKRINPDLGIKCVASQVVPASELQSKQAKEFGCSVDYNVYTKKANPKPKGTATNIRSAGCHLHFGYDCPNIDQSLLLIKYFDLCIGIPSIIKDPDIKRRSLYGKAGCFRLKKYGFEYRVLSSAMMNSVSNIKFVWNQLMKAINFYNNDISLPSSSLIRDTINNSDIEMAKRLIKEYELCADCGE